MILYASIIMTGLEVVSTGLTTFMIMCILDLNSPNMLMSLNYLMSIQYIQYVIFKIYKKVTYLALINTLPGCHQFSLSIQCCFFVLSSRNPHSCLGPSAQVFQGPFHPVKLYQHTYYTQETFQGVS